MTNFFSSARFGFLLFCSIQLFSHIQPIDSLKATEYNIDVEASMSDNNIVNQIDRFLDAGLRYQEETTKRFDYKHFMKKAYNLLDDQNASISDAVRKDLKKRIQNRIEVRHFQTNSIGAFNPELVDYCDYTNVLQGAILETCIGTVMRAIPELKDVSSVLIRHGTWRAYNEHVINERASQERKTTVHVIHEGGYNDRDNTPGNPRRKKNRD